MTPRTIVLITGALVSLVLPAAAHADGIDAGARVHAGYATEDGAHHGACVEYSSDFADGDPNSVEVIVADDPASTLPPTQDNWPLLGVSADGARACP